MVSISSKGKEKQKRTEDSEDDDQDSDFRPRKRVTRGSQSTSQLDGVEDEDDDEVPEVMDDTEEEAAPVRPRGRPRKRLGIPRQFLQRLKTTATKKTRKRWWRWNAQAP